MEKGGKGFICPNWEVATIVSLHKTRGQEEGKIYIYWFIQIQLMGPIHSN